MTTRPVTPTIQTVRGPVAAASLGAVLTHEHIVVSSPEFARDYPDLAWPDGRDAEIERVAQLVQAVKDRGIDTIVDCTAFFHGRDVDFVKQVNARVDINIVVSTGIYTYDYLPYVVAFRPVESGERDVLTTMFVRDLEVGIGDSGVRAHNIKVATDVAGVTPNNERILRAAARAAVETGAPITAHTHAANHSGLEQQRIFAEEGVDLTRVVVGHSGDSTDLDYLRRLLDAGSAIGSDRFGLNGAGRASEDERLDVVATLCGEGYARQVLLSHDALLSCDWKDSFAAYPATWTPTYVSDVILPALRERGVTESDLRAMMVEAPLRLFGALDGVVV